MVQFAARNGKEFADAAELVAPFADAVDLNCGCPQRYNMNLQYLLHIAGPFFLAFQYFMLKYIFVQVGDVGRVWVSLDQAAGACG